MTSYQITWTETSHRQAWFEAASKADALAALESGDVDGYEIDGGIRDVKILTREETSHD